MRTRPRIVPLTLGCAGWLVLAVCCQEAVAAEQDLRKAHEPDVKPPAVSASEAALTRPTAPTAASTRPAATWPLRRSWRPNEPEPEEKALCEGFARLYPAGPQHGPRKWEDEPGPKLTGYVEMSDGSALAGALVILAHFTQKVTIEDGVLSYGGPATLTDEDGRFTLPQPPPRMPYGLLVRHDHGQGYCEDYNVTTGRPVKITVKPWGRIEGTVLVGTKPVPDRVISVHVGGGGRYVDQNRTARTDARGHFALDRVAAGHFYISRKTEIELRASTHTVEEYHLSRNLEPAETVQVALGGVGRPVLARVNLPDEISRRIERGEVAGICDLGIDTTQSAVLPEEESPEFQRLRERRGAFLLAPDGRIRMEDVPAGPYRLEIDLVQRKQAGQPPLARDPEIAELLDNPLGWAMVSFVVPAMPGDRSDEPLDIGTVEFHAVPEMTQAARDLLEHTLTAHEASQGRLQAGEGRFRLELHQVRDAGDSASGNGAKSLPYDLLSPADGWMRVAGKWWFLGLKYRMDRNALTLQKGERPATSRVGSVRSCHDGESRIEMNSADILRRAGKGVWAIHIRGVSHLRMCQALLTPDPIDIRLLQLPFEEPLREFLLVYRRRQAVITAEEQNGLIRISMDGGSRAVNASFDIDPNQGFNIVQAEGFNSEHKLKFLEFTASYQKAGDAWFAGKLRKQQHLGFARDPKTLTITLEVTDARIGHPVNDKVFTLDGMGIPDGASVIDWRVSPTKRYVYHPPEGAEPFDDESSEPDTTQPTDSPGE